MRKTVSITISGQLFHIEEQAYRKLDEYLESIRYHFSTYEDREEIISDIEGRVSEHFAEKLTKARNVVSEADVDHLIAHMGTIKDFEAFESDAPSPETSHKTESPAYTPPKRLYRDVDNEMIGGVAAGIANYFGVDPTAVRLIFAISLLFGGAGIIVYIVLWIVMPEAKTTSEKMEMRGQPLTLKRIEETIRENIPAAREHIKPGAFTRAVQFSFTLLRQFFDFVGNVASAVVPALGRIIGLFIVIISSIALFALTFCVIMLASGSWDNYMDVPLRSIADGLAYYMVILAGFVTAFVPGVLIVLVGASLLLFRNMFRFPLVISLLALWVMGLMLGAVTLGTEGPMLMRNIEHYVDSYNTAAYKSIEAEPFRSIRVNEHYRVRVRTGTGDSLSVTGPQRAVDELRVEVIDGVLTISRASRNYFCIICLSNTAVVDVVMADGTLENIEAMAGGSIDLDGINLTGERVLAKAGARIITRNGDMPAALHAEAHAGSRIDIEAANVIDALTIESAAGARVIYAGEAINVNVDSQAGTSVELSGSGAVLNARITAGSDLKAMEFSVQEADIRVTAGARARVNVSQRLTGSANAGARIDYIGQPTVDVDTDRSGKVNQLDQNL